MEKKVLVAYATKHGATTEIAQRIGQHLESAGIKADVLPANPAIYLEPYTAVVLGSAVYAGKWRPEAVNFLKDNESLFRDKQLWLFSSGPTGEGDPIQLTKGWRYPETLQPIVERLQPHDITVFHGELDNKKINLFERWMIRTVQAPFGDYRDWEAIDDWTHLIVTAVRDYIGV